MEKQKLRKIRSPEILVDSSETDKAYIAGFFDGDGCAAIYGSRRRGGNSIYYQCVIVFAQARFDKLQRMRFIVRRYRGVMNFYPKKKNFARMCQLRICGSEALRLAHDIYPYCKVRQKQLKVLIEFEEIKARRREYGCTGARLKTAYLEDLEKKKCEMHVLNRRGDRRGRNFDWNGGDAWRAQLERGGGIP